MKTIKMHEIKEFIDLIQGICEDREYTSSKITNDFLEFLIRIENLEERNTYLQEEKSKLSIAEERLNIILKLAKKREGLRAELTQACKDDCYPVDMILGTDFCEEK